MEYFYGSNGELHGPLTFFFPNGGIKNQLNYRHGKYHGQSTVYHSLAILQRIFNYKDGVIHGLAKEWDKDGQLLEEGYFAFVASDMHDLTRRYNQMAECRELISQHVGDEQAQALTLTIPQSITQSINWQ